MTVVRKSIQAAPEKSSFRQGTLRLAYRAYTWQRRKIGTVTIIFIIIALFSGLIIAQEVPYFWALDESAHFSRAYQVSKGQFLPQKLPDENYGGSVPASVVTLRSAVGTDLAGLTPNELSPDALLTRHDLRHRARLQDIASQKINHTPPANYDFPGSAVYSPVAYTAPAAGILVCRLADCSLGSTIVTARIFGLVAYIGVVAFAIWLLRKRRLQWLVFTVALLPMTLFQVAAVSTDGAVIALSLLLFALVSKAFLEKKLSPALSVLLLVTAVMLPLIKINYGFLDLGALPVLVILCKDKRKALGYAIACLLLVAIVCLAWTYLVREPAHAIGTLQAANTPSSVVSARQQGQFILQHPLTFVGVLIGTGVTQGSSLVYSMAGVLSLNSVQLPSAAVVSSYLLLVTATFYSAGEIIRYKFRALLLGVSAIFAAFSIFLALYLTFTVVGKPTIDGLQGRYFIPLLPFLLTAFGAFIPVRVTMSPKTATILFSVGSTLMLISGMVYYGLATY